jgi:PAS domain S-box-containing protein
LAKASRKTILLVEDEAIIALSQKLFLEKYGYRVLTTNTGEKAVEIMLNDARVELALVPESKKRPLEDFGYEVIVAGSPDEAVGIARADPAIDLVLMDIDLGSGIDGTQAAELILKDREIPILFLSSHTEPDIVEKTEKITSYGYVVKSSSITVLDASIKMAFKLFDARTELEGELGEKRRAAERLSASETRYRQLFESAKEGILVLDAATGRIVDANPFLGDLIGYPPDALAGRVIWDVGPLRDLVGDREKFRELREKNYVRYDNLTLRTKAGTVVEVEFNGKVYGEGDAAFIQCGIRDVSGRRAVEAGLEAARREVAAIKAEADAAADFAAGVMATVRDPLLCLDGGLRVVAASRSYYGTFGSRPEDTVGRRVYELGGRQWDIPDLRAALEDILPLQGAFEGFEAEADFAGLGRRTMRLHARQLSQPAGKASAILLVFEDVTDRKAAEGKMRALLAEKEIVLKEIHHRVKNSMNTVVGLLALQAERLTDPAALEAFKDTESRVQSMMLLYDKLYRSANYAEIAADVYLAPLVDEIVANFPRGESVRTEKRIGAFVLDAKRMQSVGIIVNELITNAMKHAFAGRAGGLIAVEASLEAGRVRLSVRDDGIGIPAAFDFAAASGFGLTLVRMLAEQLGGTVRLERDGGTSVVVSFRL